MTKEKTVVKLPSSVEEKIIDKVVDLSQYIGEIAFYPYQLPFARRLTESIITNEGATLSALFSRQCITENSFIMDRNGNVTQIKNHPDAWKAKESSDSIYEIKTFGGHVIYCTEEHPIFTENGWTPAQCVEKGMKVVVLDQWDRFGDGVIQYNNKSFTINDDLAELVGWLTANIKGEENVEIVIGHTRVKELLNKYFPDTKVLSTKSKIIVTLTGKLKLFLKNIIKYSKEGIPYALNNFTKQQLILFFYPLFLTNGKIYRKINSIKIVLKDNSRPRLLFYKEHLNKLGLHGNQEVWIGQNLSFQCATNYDRFKELFSDYLPTNYFVPYFKNRERKLKTFVGEDGEILKYSKVHSVKKIEDWPYPVWDINVPDKGWFLTSGIKVHNSGKCLAKGTEVVMYDGTFKKVEDIYVGDKLLTPDSKPVKVTSTVNGKDTMYKISPIMKNQQDASYTVNSAHILSLYNIKTKQIEDINVLDYINSPNKVNYRGVRAVAYFPKRKISVAPYFLGLWLGDGDSRDTRITNVDKEIIDYLYEYAANLNMNISTYSYSNRTPSYSITSKEDSTRSYSNQHRVNIIRKEMEHLNLFGNKHIPEDYLCNSYENRMQLLAGLIDSDGSLDKHQVRYEISCSNNILCEQIVRLARSLGFQVTLSKRVTSCNKKDFVSNRIVIYGEIWKIPVRVARKKAPKGSIKKNPLLYKIKVEEVGLGEYYGFTLDNKEKRFLLKDFTITHNTQIVAMITAALMIILPTLADKYPENFSIFQKGFWAGCFGPVGEQAVTMFDRIYEVFTTDSCKQLFIEELKMPIPSRGGARGNLIRLQNKSFVRYMSGSKRAKVESKTYHLIILDECQDIDSFKIRKCFAEGTEVWLPNGNIVPVEQVVKEKLDVITPDGPKTPTEWYDNGVQDVWKITTNKGKTIEVTENHRFLVRRRIGNRQAKIDILKNIKVGDAIAAPLEVPYFGNKWTYKEGLLTGLMLGDGCFTGGQPLFCGFSSVIDKLEKLLLHDCSLTKQEPKESGLISCGIRGNGTGNYVTAFFKELGLWGHKGDTKFIPAGGSKEFLRGIIEGLIETDGCVQANEISFANISEKLVRDLQNNLLRFGIHTFITSHINNGNFGNKPKRLWVLHIKDSTSIIKFASNFKLITKQNKLNILAEKKKAKTPRLQAKDKRRSNDSRFVFEKVNNIEYIGKKNTYCLTVETNLLVANGLMPGQSINPMGAAVNATTVATGTPDVYIGYFYDTIEQNKSFDLKNPSAKQSHFEVDYSIAQKYNAYYKKYIQKEIKRLGFDSEEFKMAYRLIWPITKGMVFTKSQLEEKCYDKSLKIVTTWKETPCIAGLDLGKSQDSTVVTVIKPIWGEEDEEGNMPKVLLNWLEIEGDEWEDQYPQVIEFLSNYNIETLICDTTGVGDPIRERYTVLLPSVNVGPFTFSPSSKDRGYKYLIQEINSKRLVIPAHYSVRKTNKFKKFENQMTTLKKNYSGKFLNPCPIDKDKGHDDYSDSLMLAVFGTYFEILPEIEVTQNDIFIPPRNNAEQLFGRNYSRVQKTSRW